MRTELKTNQISPAVGRNLIVPLELSLQNRFLLDQVLPALKTSGITGGWGGYFDRVKRNGSGALSFHVTSEAAGRALLSAIENGGDSVGGTVRTIVDTPRDGTECGSPLAGPSARAFYEMVSMRTMPIIEQGLEQIARASATPLGLSLDLLVVHMFVVRRCLALRSGASVDEQYPSGFMSFRSHAEGFFVLSNDTERSRAEMERRYQSVAKTVRARIRQLERKSGIESASPLDGAWAEHLDTLVESTYAELKAGQLQAVAGDGDGNASGKNLYNSAFHRKLYSSGAFRRLMNGVPGSANRIITGLTYLTLHRLGLPLIERYFLCYAISRGVEDEYGIDVDRAIADALARAKAKYPRPWQFWKWAAYFK